MSVEANKVLVLRWLDEVVNQGNVAVEPELVATDVRWRVNWWDLNRGSRGGNRRAFPDLRKSVRLLVAEGDLVMVYGSYTGTHLDTFDSPVFGQFLPTGNRVRWPYVTIVRIAAGRIVEIRELIEWQTLVEQLRAEPEPPASLASSPPFP
jgi:predicted ester cyclase